MIEVQRKAEARSHPDLNHIVAYFDLGQMLWQ